MSYEEPRLSLYARICDKLRCCPKMQVNQDDPRNIIVTDEVEQLYAGRWCCCEWVSSTLSLLPCWCCWSQAKKARKRARKEEKLRIKREGLAKAAASSSGVVSRTTFAGRWWPDGGGRMNVEFLLKVCLTRSLK